jgi:uncharacterized protein
MPGPSKAKIGSIMWRDLTVPNGTEIKDFYSKVVGWESAPQAMDGYDDFNINLPGTSETVAGICHARGSNAKIPAQWLIYITVESVEASAKLCVEGGNGLLALLAQFAQCLRGCLSYLTRWIGESLDQGASRQTCALTELA